MATSEVDPSGVEAFQGKVLGDTSAALVTVLAVIGDRLGLFKDLAENRRSLGDRVGVQQVNSLHRARLFQPNRGQDGGDQVD